MRSFLSVIWSACLEAAGSLQSEDWKASESSTVGCLDPPIFVAAFDGVLLRLVDSEGGQVAECDARLQRFRVVVTLVGESHDLGETDAVTLVELVLELLDGGPREHEDEEHDAEREREPRACHRKRSCLVNRHTKHGARFGETRGQRVECSAHREAPS